MGMNVREATEHWVREFNEYPRNMIEELMNIDPYDWEEVTDIEINDTEYRMIGKLPSWGTLWSFGSWLDEMWLDNYDGISKMSKLGFVIFKSKKYGYFFGIDGADTISTQSIGPHYTRNEGYIGMKRRKNKWDLDQEHTQLYGK